MPCHSSGAIETPCQHGAYDWAHRGMCVYHPHPRAGRGVLPVFKLSISARFFAALLSACIIAVPSWAGPSELPRTADKFVIDGKLEESAWESAIRIDLEIETDPGENLVATVATRAFLIEDGENLYVAFEADDPDPTQIRAHLRDRDAAWNDDHVGIVLDTYNDGRRAL